MFVSVLVAPLIVLFVSVVVLDAVTTATPFDVSDVNAPVDGMIAPIGCVSQLHYESCSQEKKCKFRRCIVIKFKF